MQYNSITNNKMLLAKRKFGFQSDINVSCLLLIANNLSSYLTFFVVLVTFVKSSCMLTFSLEANNCLLYTSTYSYITIKLIT